MKIISKVANDMMICVSQFVDFFEIKRNHSHSSIP